MRAWLVVLIMVAACDGGSPPPAASGALMLRPPADADTPATMGTEVQVLTSSAVAERVVRELALNENPAFMGTAGDGEVEDATRKLRDIVDARVREGTHVIDVAVRGQDPELAAAVCNALMEAFVRHRLEERLAAVTRDQEWLAEQRDGLRRQRDEAVGALAAYEAAHPDEPAPDEAADGARLRSAAEDARRRLQQVEDRASAAEGARAQVTAPVTVLERCRPVTR